MLCGLVAAGFSLQMFKNLIKKQLKSIFVYNFRWLYEYYLNQSKTF